MRGKKAKMIRRSVAVTSSQTDITYEATSTRTKVFSVMGFDGVVRPVPMELSTMKFVSDFRRQVKNAKRFYKSLNATQRGYVNA